MSNEINLIGGFYEAKSLPFSAQDTVNWLPVPSQVQGSRSPIKLRGLPGLSEFGSDANATLSLSGDAPNAVRNAVYTPYNYTATGGQPPYVFSIGSGTLPTGLSMSSGGQITGTPTVVESKSFVVSVVDANSDSATLPDSIDVAAEPANVLISQNQMSLPGTSYNLPMPAGAAENDIAVVFGVSITPTAPSSSVATFIPSASYTPTTFGTAAGPWGAYSFAWMKKLSASDASGGIPLVLSSGSTAQTGNFTVYVIKASKVYSPFEQNSSCVASNNSGNASTGGLLASYIYAFAGYECVGPRVATAYPLANGNRAINASVNVYSCYDFRVKPSPSFNAGNWSASGTLIVESAVSIAIGAIN